MYPALVFEPRREKTPGPPANCICANNKGVGQPHSLINAFVVRYLESMIT